MSDAKPVRTMNDIPGWFTWTDQQLFRYFLHNAAPELPGDLVELGTYMGKSAVLIGEYRRPDERFVVCDLFNDESDLANNIENTRSYRSLTREAFEANYQAVRGELPEVVQGLSSTITEHVAPASVRFMHVDASHLYEHVVIDIASATSLLTSDGIVVFDDIQSRHTPGVAAAVWSAVVDGRLKPICMTPSKLYATLGDPTPIRSGFQDWLIKFGRLMWETQEIAGLEIIRLWPPPPAKPAAPAANPDFEDALRRINRRLTRIEQQLTQTNRQLEQSFGRRVQRSVIRRVKKLRTATPQA
ncbi:MAG TPA: class I SAM-dependent methyltransferase [Propionibacteriaceae bacterium]|nr:class I SAM-dependent methyltransferase [Propionibacteriaceae bacterium]